MAPTNKYTYWEYNGTTTDVYTVVVAPGNYTIDGLCAALGPVCVAGANKYAFTANHTTLKVTKTLVSGPHMFGNETDGHNDIAAKLGFTTPQGLFAATMTSSGTYNIVAFNINLVIQGPNMGTHTIAPDQPTSIWRIVVPVTSLFGEAVNFDSATFENNKITFKRPQYLSDMVVSLTNPMNRNATIDNNGNPISILFRAW